MKPCPTATTLATPVVPTANRVESAEIAGRRRAATNGFLDQLRPVTTPDRDLALPRTASGLSRRVRGDDQKLAGVRQVHARDLRNNPRSKLRAGSCVVDSRFMRVNRNASGDIAGKPGLGSFVTRSFVTRFFGTLRTLLWSLPDLNGERICLSCGMNFHTPTANKKAMTKLHAVQRFERLSLPK